MLNYFSNTEFVNKKNMSFSEGAYSLGASWSMSAMEGGIKQAASPTVASECRHAR